MPDVLVEVKGEWLKGRQGPFLGAVHAAIVEALRTPTTDKVLRLIEHPAECFLVPLACGERFTHIEITMFSGRTLETKRALQGDRPQARAVRRTAGRRQDHPDRGGHQRCRHARWPGGLRRRHRL